MHFRGFPGNAGEAVPMSLQIWMDIQCINILCEPFFEQPGDECLIRAVWKWKIVGRVTGTHYNRLRGSLLYRGVNFPDQVIIFVRTVSAGFAEQCERIHTVSEISCEVRREAGGVFRFCRISDIRASLKRFSGVAPFRIVPVGKQVHMNVESLLTDLIDHIVPFCKIRLSSGCFHVVPVARRHESEPCESHISAYLQKLCVSSARKMLVNALTASASAADHISKKSEPGFFRSDVFRRRHDGVRCHGRSKLFSVRSGNPGMDRKPAVPLGWEREIMEKGFFRFKSKRFFSR